MEHTLGVQTNGSFIGYNAVLILVLMEHTLGGLSSAMMKIIVRCLNPCFNGTYSRSEFKSSDEIREFSLNPCFNGTYSRSDKHGSKHDIYVVLILVLMEHTLGGCRFYSCNAPQNVLILVLMEHTLGV